MLQFSRTLAIVGGVLLPVVETIRRWNQLGDIRMAPAWLDDYFVGAFLLYGAWRTRANATDGRGVLAAAWAFACGMGYSAFFSQLVVIDRPDPSGVSPVAVVAAKGVALALAIAALIVTLRSKPERETHLQHLP
jgi:hypothetical protein